MSDIGNFIFNTGSEVVNSITKPLEAIAIAMFIIIILWSMFQLLKALGVLYFMRIQATKYKKILSKSFRKNKYRNFVGMELECLRHSKGVSDSSLENFNFSWGTDASISGKGSGREYRSLPANGDSLFKMIDGFTKELNKTKHTVNKSCGLHIHIETLPDLNLIKKLYCFYSKYEDLFFDMLPKSRQRNKFCDKFGNLDNYEWDEVMKVKSLTEFKKLFYNVLFKWKIDYGHSHDKRYCWINFHSIFYRGTLEIRAHSGTINAEKIKKWILIHLAIRKFLDKTSLENIEKIKPTKKNFLRLFSKDTQGYIQKRWECFPDNQEEDFKLGRKK